VTIRELLQGLLDHTADGRRTDDEVIVRVGDVDRAVEASYSDGTFILIAGPPLPR
jgi:hypothetical protein